MSPMGRVMRYSGIAPEGSVLDVPNPVLGFLYYIAHIIYPRLQAIPFPMLDPLACTASTLVGLFSMWLGYQLLFVLQDVCIVCLSSYVVNAILLFNMFAIMGLNKKAVRLKEH